MLCPNCKTENLVTSESRTIQIDHCPRCRGVWLDRGELEKLIQMASTDDERQSGRDFGEDGEAPRKRSYGENNQEDDDDDRGESHQSRGRDDGERGSERGDSYGSRDRDYDQRTGRGEPEGGRSIWREIFENLGDKLPRS
jgi:Zn-finger nucleic acid-binding protein